MGLSAVGCLFGVCMRFRSGDSSDLDSNMQTRVGTTAVVTDVYSEEKQKMSVGRREV